MALSFKNQELDRAKEEHDKMSKETPSRHMFFSMDQRIEKGTLFKNKNINWKATI